MRKSGRVKASSMRALPDSGGQAVAEEEREGRRHGRILDTLDYSTRTAEGMGEVTPGAVGVIAEGERAGAVEGE